MSNIGIGEELEATEEFWEELKKCEIFKLHHPKGGHYNDGHSLKATIYCHSPEDLINLFNLLGIAYTLHFQDPTSPTNEESSSYGWCRPITINNTAKWLALNTYNSCLTFDTHLEIDTQNYNITISIAIGSWYSVSLEEVQAARSFEKKLENTDICIDNDNCYHARNAS